MFADTYFKRFDSQKPLFSTQPDPELDMIVVIPCFNEPKLFKTIDSLLDADRKGVSVEVIVVVNSSEESNHSVLAENAKSLEYLTELSKSVNTDTFKILVVDEPNLPKKYAGVGLARKIGIDQAVHRANFINKPEILILSLDADTLVAPNYFTSILKQYELERFQVATINFEHKLNGKYSDKQYESIAQYELYLRYYVNAMLYSGFPFSHYTIGSAFCFTAQTYCKQGGMNKKQAGEDFYFLHKLFPVSKTSIINSTSVYPDSRVSDRVPFGTGLMVSKLMNQSTQHYPTYNFRAFEEIKDFMSHLESFYMNKTVEFVFSICSDEMKIFLIDSKFEQSFAQICKQSPTIKIFRQRFFQWFTAFRYFKYLNDSHNSGFYAKMELLDGANKLAQRLDIQKHQDYKSLLKNYREFDMKK